MERTFDFNQKKRATLIARRGIDFLAVSAVFDDRQRVDWADTRFDYGEERRLTVGKVDGEPQKRSSSSRRFEPRSCALGSQ